MILLLGGTTEATALARLMADCGIAAVVSLAGRTRDPAPLPLPVRSGGFGGAEGLARVLAAEGVAAVVDATHPFAKDMSANAAAACRQAGVPLLVLSRSAWRPGPGDRWTEVIDAAAAVAALGEAARRVFFTAGRQVVPALLAAPQHHYLIRCIDPPGALPPRATLILARGPFAEAGECDLMRRHAIEVLVAKNAGGSATAAKLRAARALGLPVILLAVPPPSGAERTESVEAALAWVARQAHGVQPRGV